MTGHYSVAIILACGPQWFVACEISEIGMSSDMSVGPDITPKTIYWHRDLPPASAQAIGEHTVEANSARVPGTLGHRDELWESCYQALIAQTRDRLEQEIARLGGDYVHVLSEAIEPRHDETRGEAWLHGRFTYVLYRGAEDRSLDADNRAG